MSYVGLVQQGTVINQRVVEVGDDREAIEKQINIAAAKLNSASSGESLEWTIAVLPVPPK